MKFEFSNLDRVQVLLVDGLLDPVAKLGDVGENVRVEVYFRRPGQQSLEHR